MGGLSITHLIILLVFFIPGIVLVFMKPVQGRNRFGAAPEPKSFRGALATCFRQYANFNGRASRSEFWWWFATVSVGTILSQRVVAAVYGDQDSIAQGVPPVLILVLLLPTLAVTARRLHDRNMSGWVQILGFAFGSLVLWYKLAQPAGPQPTEAEEREIPVAPEPSPATLSISPLRPTAAIDDAMAQIERLRTARDNGTLTEDEFLALKAKVIGPIS